MFSKLIWNLHRNISHSSIRNYARLPSVFDTKEPLKILKHGLLDGRLDKILPCPRECDILIIGGSVVGSSIAYFLKEQQNQLNVMVVEADSSYCNASALLSVGGMRQQFSCRENTEMSQFGFEFLRRANDLLAVKGELPPDVQFNHAGYLILADKDGAETMYNNYETQVQCGANSILLSTSMLKERYPWLNTDGIELATLGLQGEGWFDPAALLSGLRGKNRFFDIPYINGKVIGFEHEKIKVGMGETYHKLEMVLVELANGDIQPVKTAFTVNAAGPYAGQVAQLAGIGDSSIDPLCGVPLPVEPRKRLVFNVHCSDGPGLDCPLVVDCSQDSVYFRREGLGNNYLCGISPAPEHEHDHSDLTVDYHFFDTHIWPKLAQRVPAFEALKVKAAWGGYYDYNFVDHNLVIGNHPYFKNFLFANGSSGHGLQHAPAMGRAITELINYQEYRTVDLNDFSFDRFLDVDTVDSVESEKNVV